MNAPPFSSSSLVEFEVGIEVELGVGWSELVLGVLFRSGGVGGWLEKVQMKLNSTQFVGDVEVSAELGNITILDTVQNGKFIYCLN